MSTPPRVAREAICPPAPTRPSYTCSYISCSFPIPVTTPIFNMKIEMRQHGCVDEESDEKEDDWMTKTIYFASRDAMARYFTFIYELNDDSSEFEAAILLYISENSSLDTFLEKIISMTSEESWQLNKNLNIYIYTDVIIE